MDCQVEDCDDVAAFELHVPWADNEYVCGAHARVRSRQDGIVADPLDSAAASLPDGASRHDD